MSPPKMTIGFCYLFWSRRTPEGVGTSKSQFQRPSSQSSGDSRLLSLLTTPYPHILLCSLFSKYFFFSCPCKRSQAVWHASLVSYAWKLSNMFPHTPRCSRAACSGFCRIKVSTFLGGMPSPETFPWCCLWTLHFDEPLWTPPILAPAPSSGWRGRVIYSTYPTWGFCLFCVTCQHLNLLTRSLVSVKEWKKEIMNDLKKEEWKERTVF